MEAHHVRPALCPTVGRLRFSEPALPEADNPNSRLCIQPLEQRPPGSGFMPQFPAQVDGAQPLLVLSSEGDTRCPASTGFKNECLFPPTSPESRLVFQLELYLYLWISGSPLLDQCCGK